MRRLVSQLLPYRSRGQSVLVFFPVPGLQSDLNIPPRRAGFSKGITCEAPSRQCAEPIGKWHGTWDWQAGVPIANGQACQCVILPATKWG